jgi:hypothetical protein
MLNHAIYYKSAFERLVYLNQEKYAHCVTSADEWDMVESLCNCLKKLQEATELFSGCQYPTTNLFWWKFCEIKLEIRAWCASANTTIATWLMRCKRSMISIERDPTQLLQWHASLILHIRKSWWNIFY